MKKAFIWFSLKHPRYVLSLYAILTLVFVAVIPSIQTDTDPVKMLNANNPAVVLYNQMKSDFKYYDVVVLGIKQTKGESLFTVEALERLHKLTWDITRIGTPKSSNTGFSEFINTIQWFGVKTNTPKGKRLIVVEDIISPSTVDNIALNEKGELNVRPLMKEPPANETEARQILATIHDNRILRGKLASDDGSLVGIFIPLERGMKSHAYYLGNEIEKLVSEYLSPDEVYYLAGLPIAETTFGFEMFIQMGIFAPLAGVMIFLLMYLFFGSIKLAVGPMLLAMMTVICAMGGLIYSGNTVHIMSSMIPIFLMPIALLDSIHIISHLHDKIGGSDSKKEIIWGVMNSLFNPMLFTSLTTTVGFASLAITGIQPVEVFGITIAFGVMAAWFFSMTFMPAFVVCFDFQKIKVLKRKTHLSDQVVQRFCKLATEFPVAITICCIVICIVSIIGISKITVNDNPVRWFKAEHTLRKADEIMNQQLAGTYMANLVFSMPTSNQSAKNLHPTSNSQVNKNYDDADLFNTETEEIQLPDLRDKEIIRYIEKIQNHLLSVKDKEGKPIVGAATSIVDILRKVGRVAFNDPTIPSSRNALAQYMFLYESGDIKRGKDLWKFITTDYQKAQIWLQLKNGDNQTMDLLMESLEKYMKLPENAPPEIDTDGSLQPIRLSWTGLTHINNVWQDEMVKGMGYALLGSFAVVFVMMTLLFKSPLWGMISMFPLSLSILFIYGLIGWGGKYYDMPIAVLSSLALGLSIDFAIHFNQSFRELIKKTRSFSEAISEVFKEPSRAIWRNVLVLAIGFTPLFFAELVPYVTVGAFFFLIMIISGVASLVLLPSLIILLKKKLSEVKDLVSY